MNIENTGGIDSTGIVNCEVDSASCIRDLNFLKASSNLRREFLAKQKEDRLLRRDTRIGVILQFPGKK